MRKSLEIRQALGAAVDEAKNFIGKPEYEDKKRAVTTLETELTQTLEIEATEARQAERFEGGPEGARAIEGTPTMPADNGGLHSAHARGLRRGWQPEDYLRNATSLARMGGIGAVEKDKSFGSFGEFLQSVVRYYATKGTQQDSRLVRAPTGASEVDPTGGGFLVQTDFATAIFTRAYDMGEILGEVNKIGISTGANGIKIPAVDETSRATGSRWGGVQSYWVAEGTSVTATKPKFRQIELDLKKLMSTFYITDEMLQDRNVLQTLALQAFSEEIMFMTEDAIVEGSGAGQPLGVINAPCKVAVSKQTGQAAATLVYENILNMYSRMWSRSRKNAKWYINQDIEPQLFALSQTIGVGGVPVYLPAGGISGNPYGTLLGRPVVPTEYNATLGTEGDILFADFSQYVLADKGGIQAAQSMHVAFLTDEMVLRITYRVDGEPIWNSALTPFKGSATKSPFITLATRS